MNREQLLNRYAEILHLTGLQYSQVVIGYGGAMLVLGMREETSDLDLDISNMTDFHRCAVELQKCAEPITKPIYAGDGFIIRAPELDADFHHTFVDPYFRDDVIYDHINQIAYYHPKKILRMKQRLNREKDQKDIKVLEEWIKKKDMEDLMKEHEDLYG